MLALVIMGREYGRTGVFNRITGMGELVYSVGELAHSMQELGYYGRAGALND